jgi:PAS domain S-box-containing protein
MVYSNDSTNSPPLNEPDNTETTRLRWQSPTAIAIFAGLAILYFMLAHLTLSTLHSDGLISAIWSPAGFSLGAILLIGRLFLPFVWLGSFVFMLSLDIPWLSAGGIAVGITLQAWIGAMLLQRMQLNPALTQLRDVGALILFGALLTTPIAPAIGLLSLSWNHSYNPVLFGSLFGQWWLSDAIAVVMITPLLLTWFTQPLKPEQYIWRDPIQRWQYVAEVGVWLTLLLTLSWLVFVYDRPSESALYPIEYLPFPLIIWAALRFGQRGTTLGNLCVAAIATWGALQGVGPFQVVESVRSTLFLQTFLGIVGITGLLLAATMTERQRAIRQLRAIANSLDQQVAERSQQLKASEARIHRLMESNLIGIFFWDDQGNILEANDAFCQLVGYSRAEVLAGQVNWLEVLPAEHRALSQQLLREMRYAEIPSPFEIEYLRRDGRRVPILVGATHFNDPDRFGVGFVLDLTDYKRTRAALEESEKRFRRLVESNMFGVAFGNAEQGICYANGYFLNMMGYTEADLQTGQIPWEQITPVEFLKLETRSAKELRKRGVCTPFERDYIRKDGTRVPVLIGGALLQEPYDQQQEMIAFYLDLTERKRTEQVLRLLAEVGSVLTASLNANTTLKNLAKLTIPSLADYCLIFMMEEGKLVRGSTAAHANLDQEQLLHQLESLSRCELDRANPLITKVLRTGRSLFLPQITKLPTPEFAHVQQLIQFQSELLPVSLMVVPLIAHSKTLGAIVLATSESKRQYHPIDLALAEDIARRVALAMENVRLYRQAQAVNRIKDEFLATLSHELRSPLNGILGWAQLLRRRHLDSETTSQGLETIERNAKAQVQLIDDLLDISRVIRGKLRLDVRPINLIPVIEAAIDAMRPAADAKEISLKWDVDPDAGLISGDPDRLQQVLWNLLSNAIKFTPKQGEVTVRLQRAETQVEITVSDTGKGINPDFLPFVFERFRQADGSLTRSYGGLGLGLAIVRHLIELHGGTVQAFSPGEGQGSTFTVKLPLFTGESDSYSHSQTEHLPLPHDSAARVPRLDRVRVLVVDDEADTRTLLATALKDCGAEVETAASAEAAIAQLDQFQPQILVSDIGLPYIDGYALIRQIRQRCAEEGGDIPAIALTAYARQEDRRQALLAGFQTQIAKPINPNELVVVVGNLSGQIHKSNRGSTDNNSLRSGDNTQYN